MMSAQSRIACVIARVIRELQSSQTLNKIQAIPRCLGKQSINSTG